MLHGWVKVQMMNVAMYHEASNPATIARYARDLPRTRADRLFYDHALFGLAIGVGCLVAVFGWQVGLLAALTSTSTSAARRP